MIGRRRDERGVSLILVLVALVVFGLLVPVLGQFGSTNGVSGYLLAGQRYDRYTAEAGVQEAIAWAQANRPVGRHGVPCKGLQTTTLGTGNGQRSATVTCEGYANGGVPQATATAPKFAVQGTGGAIQLDGGKYRTNGPWWSDGTIDASGVDASRDYVGAGGSCNGLQAAPAECNTGRTEKRPALDVPLPPLKPDARRDPSCQLPASHVIAIAPGYHWQREYFDAIADGRNGCDQAVLWLRPGVHVFDFDFYRLPRGGTPSFSARDGHVVVVGGAQNGWSEGAGSNQYPVVRQAILQRNACVADGAGTAVVTANDSYFEFNPGSGNSADVQICGASVNGVPVSYAQLTGQGGDPAPIDVTATPTSISASGPWDHGLSMPSRPAPDPLATVECSGSGGAACDDAHTLRDTLTGDNVTGTITASFADPIPAGARLDTLQVTVNHREQEHNNGIRRLRLYVTGLGSAVNARVCDLTDPNHRMDPSDPWRRSPDVFTCDLRGNVFEPYVPASGPVRVVYQAEMDRGDGRNDGQASVDVTLDQIEFKATYAPVKYRDAVTLASGRTVLQVDRQAHATFDGAVYVPTGDVLFDWADSTANGFRGGAIVRSITGQHMPDDSNYAPFELPLGGSYTDRVVTFAATVAGSDFNGALVTARVLFCDPVPGVEPRDPKCTGAPNEQPSVLAWHTRR